MNTKHRGLATVIDMSRAVCRSALLMTASFVLTGCGGGGSGGSGVISQPPSTHEQLLETDNTYTAGYEAVAANATGNAVAVWMQDSAAGVVDIWANRYINGSGWQGAELIGSGSNDMALPRVVLDANGNATVAWMSWVSSAPGDVYATRYAVGTGWTAPVQIESGAGMAGYPQLAVDSNGNVIAVWEQQLAGVSQIYASRYNGTAWSSEQVIDANSAGNAYVPQIAVDGSGNYTVAWVQYDGSYYSMYANRYVGGVWQTAQLIENLSGDVANDLPQIAASTGGTVMVVWAHTDGSVASVYANRFDGVSWGTAQLLESGAGTAETPHIALDSNGNATAVWAQMGTNVYNIWSNSYTTGGDWGAAQLIESSDSGDAGLPWVGVDAGGNVTALWMQSIDNDATFNIYANHLITGGTWSGRQLIESGAGNAEAPQGAIDGSGNVFAVWDQLSSGVYSIFANRLTY
jgi:hypothetical protein